MEILLKYYYGIEDAIITNNRGFYFIKNKQNKYLLYEIENPNEILSINEIVKTYSLQDYFYKIMKTKNNNITIKYNNKNFLLLKIENNRKENIENKIDDLKRINIALKSPIYNCLNRNNWYFLWTNKNDYYLNDNKISNLESIKEITDYYIGMAENALQYINKTSEMQKYKQIYISYKRIEKDSYMNPLNIVLDVIERDISEYLKYLYFSDNYNEKTIENVMDKIKKQSMSTELIFARLLYPTYFFDICENYNNDITLENKIMKLYKNIDKYEMFLINIYSKLNKIKKIKKIDWL